MALPASKKNWLTQVAISISLAQLSFTCVFVEVLGFASNPNARYYEPQPPSFAILWALVFDILLLALFLLACFRARTANSKPVRLIATGIIAVFVLFAGSQCARRLFEAVEHEVGTRASVAATVLLGIVGILFVACRPRAALRSIGVALLVMSPLFPLATASAIVAYRTAHIEAYGEGRAAGMLPHSVSHNRLVWVIFDELDENILFHVRPSRVSLHQFDELRAHSIYGTQVTSPNPDTMPSLLSLIMGRVVADEQADAKFVNVQLRGCSATTDFSAYPNVFKLARAGGFNTGLSGWHHPYCRLLGNDLSACAWGYGTQAFMIADRALEPRSFLKKAVYLAEWEAETFPYRSKLGITAEPGGMPETRRDMLETYEKVMSNAEEMVRDPRMNLVLVHFPTPHAPGIWDAAHGHFTTGASNYIDNLGLADESLRRLREAIQASGSADHTTLLVSSDHPYRTLSWELSPLIKTVEMQRLTRMQETHLIPFLLTFPHETEAVAYEKRFNSVLTAKLALAILQQTVSTPDQAVRWLDEHADASLRSNAAACK